METKMRSLTSDESRYMESLSVFRKISADNQRMEQFIESSLPDAISSIGNGNHIINVLGVGSGTGELDLKILCIIQAKYPRFPINADIIEPNQKQVLSYKELIAKTPGLENINFTFHVKTSSEFELQVKEEKSGRKYDFIHMIQMLYYVRDVPATLKFFRSLLASNGKLLIILQAGNSSGSTIWKKYGAYSAMNGRCLPITTDDIVKILSSEGAKYQYYDLPSHLDLTECFSDGNRDGDLLLDFLSETCDFSKTTPPEVRDEFIRDMTSLGSSSENEGKIIVKYSVGAIVVESD